MALLPEQIKKAVSHLQKCDPVLKDIIARVGPCRVKPRRDRYLTLVRSIVSQQISVAAARTIQSRLKELVAPKKIIPESLVEFQVEELRAVGVSRQKATYILDLSEKVHRGEINFRKIARMEDDEVIDELTQVKGIGVWTAQMFLMFSLGRMDTLPVGDLGIQNAVKKNYKLRKHPNAKKLKAIAEPWSPYRTIACWYMWQSLEL